MHLYLCCVCIRYNDTKLLSLRMYIMKTNRMAKYKEVKHEKLKLYEHFEQSKGDVQTCSTTNFEQLMPKKAY